MKNYRVVKVKVESGDIKYVPQFTFKKVETVKKWKFFSYLINKNVDEWKPLWKVVEGSDELIPCFYNTEKKAWNRIDESKDNYKTSIQSYEILEIKNEG